MEGTSWEPGFSLLEWAAMDQQEEEARMTYEVMGWNWRHQYKLVLTQYRYNGHPQK